MAWQRHCHPANPCWVLAMCLPCAWFYVVPRGVLALWRKGPTKDREIGRNENAWPPDCSRSRRRSEGVHDAQVAGVRCGTVGPPVQKVRARPERDIPPSGSDVEPSGVSRIPAADGEDGRGHSQESKERGIVERKKTGAGEGMEIGRSLSSRGAKRRCAVSPAKPQFPYEVEPSWGWPASGSLDSHPSFQVQTLRPFMNPLGVPGPSLSLPVYLSLFSVLLARCCISIDGGPPRSID